MPDSTPNLSLPPYPRPLSIFVAAAATCAVVGLSTQRALAQETPPPKPPAQSPKDPPPPPDSLSGDPELSDESVEDALNDMRKRPGTAPPVGPTLRPATSATPPPAGQAADPVPGMAASDYGVPTARRLREGTFLSRREGTMLRVPTGDWIFVPRPTTGGAVDRPLILMPSLTLQRLEDATAQAGERPGAIISGQVFSYRGREYLLPTVPSAASSSASQPKPAEAEKAEPRPELKDDPAVQDLIRDLESKREPTRALTPPPARPLSEKPTPVPDSPVAQDAPAVAVAEGSMITSRRGRLTRLAGGDLAFSFDSDADSRTDEPLVLLPCQTLSRMENVTLWRSESLVLEVSGRIFTYHGRNYLLPTLFIVPGPSEIGPLQ